MKWVAGGLARRALIVIGVLGVVSARADDIASFVTGGYASGLRTMHTMHMIDTDKDGMVSQEEWTAFQNKVFDAMDKNHTGFIDAKEFYGDPMGKVSFAPGAFIQGLRTKAMFEKIGPSGDGKISRDQFLKYQQKIFDMLDKDNTKQLTAGEFILKSSH
jgi:Ca2+-binding EF-hand superfamily protein